MMEKLQKLAPLKKTLVKGIGHNAFFSKNGQLSLQRQRKQIMTVLFWFFIGVFLREAIIINCY